MIDWDIVTLKDLCTEIKYGFTASSTGENTGIKFLRITDIASENLNWNTIPYCVITDSDYQKYKIEKNDIVIARTGATVGYAKIIREIKEKAVFASYLIKLKFKEGVDEKFMGILIESNIYKNFIHTIAGGSAQPNANAKDLTSFKFKIPPSPVQQKIAAIISAYDDLIENNNNRIALLENAAEEIYREWFVRMRFPGWQEVKFVKGVPEGWEEIKVAEAFEFTGGGTPSKVENRYWNDGTVNWFTPSDITAANGIFLTQSGDQCTEEGLNNSSARMFPAYSIMMTSRATIGAIGINTTPACTNQGFITCIPNENFPVTFLYHWLKLNKSYFETVSTGSTFLELTKGTFKKIKILKPEKQLVNQFEEKVFPMFKKMELLLQEVSLLKKFRDLLLSRLISGKLPVEGLDVRFPPSMSAGGGVERVSSG